MSNYRERYIEQVIQNYCYTQSDLNFWSLYTNNQSTASMNDLFKHHPDLRTVVGVLEQTDPAWKDLPEKVSNAYFLHLGTEVVKYERCRNFAIVQPSAEEVYSFVTPNESEQRPTLFEHDYVNTLNNDEMSKIETTLTEADLNSSKVLSNTDLNSKIQVPPSTFRRMSYVFPRMKKRQVVLIIRIVYATVKNYLAGNLIVSNYVKGPVQLVVTVRLLESLALALIQEIPKEVMLNGKD